MAILGQLMDGPRSGYEIKTTFRDLISNFWHVSDGQLYPTLRKLTEEGLVRREELEATNGLVKHEYTLTEKGRKTFQLWLRDTEAPVPEMKEPFLLKMIFFDHLSAPEQLRHVQDQIGQTVKLLEEYRATWRRQAQAGEGVSYSRLVADAGLLMLEARRLYLEQLRKGIESGNVAARIPLFTEESIELGREMASQLLDLFQATGTLSIPDLLTFTRADRDS